VTVAFEFQSNETIGQGVKRVVAEQLDGALSDLAGVRPRQADTAVHSVRKRFKKVRALIRLVRRGLGEEVYTLENHWFRDTGAALSEVRDAAVLVQTLDLLKDGAEPQAFTAARKRLLARRRAVRRRVLGKGNGLENASAQIALAGERLVSWPLEGADWRVIEVGIRSIYRKARDAYRATLGPGHPELFHEWRKRTKDLWHQIELLEPLWPEVLESLGEEFHALGDTLGREHDLAVLKGVLEAQASATGEPPSAVLAALAERRGALAVEAHARGARLFAEKPGAFAKRLRHYWEAWRVGEMPLAGES
jgi:CHAD domain-containing protein